MNILRVIPSMNPIGGGPCQGIRNSVPELESFGVSNEVVCLDDPNAPYLGKDSFTIHAIGASKTPLKYNKALIPWLLANFQRFDVVVIHGLWLYHSYATIKAMRYYRKNNVHSPKVFVMPHGMLDPYFQMAKERKIKAWRNSVYWKLFENKAVNQADGVLFTCKEELVLARTTFPNYTPKREINVGYGIQEPPKYAKKMCQAFVEKVPQWNKQPFLVFLSRIHPKKGIDLLIKAYLKLEKERGQLPQLVIAGPGLEHAYGQKMQELAASSSNIVFHGMLSGDAKWGAFYESEAFVLPSHQENFGIAVVEALACGKPVLISDKVNIWREIAQGNGGIVTSDTEQATYEMLREWLTLTRKEKEKMSESALVVYHNNFTIQRAAKQFAKGISKN